MNDESSAVEVSGLSVCMCGLAIWTEALLWEGCCYCSRMLQQNRSDTGHGFGQDVCVCVSVCASHHHHEEWVQARSISQQGHHVISLHLNSLSSLRHTWAVSLFVSVFFFSPPNIVSSKICFVLLNSLTCHVNVILEMWDSVLDFWPQLDSSESCHKSRLMIGTQHSSCQPHISTMFSS